MNDNINNLQVSNKFLKEMNELTKMAIKLYLSLSFMKYKRGEPFRASHKEIAVNYLDDYDGYSNRDAEAFYIRTDFGMYFKALKQLERLKLIKVYRSRTKNGGHEVNRYWVY